MHENVTWSLKFDFRWWTVRIYYIPCLMGPVTTRILSTSKTTTWKSCFIDLYHVNAVMYLNFVQIWFPSNKSDSIHTHSGKNNLCTTCASVCNRENVIFGGGKWQDYSPQYLPRCSTIPTMLNCQILGQNGFWQNILFKPNFTTWYLNLSYIPYISSKRSC